jgi:hypothetical protein
LLLLLLWAIGDDEKNQFSDELENLLDVLLNSIKLVNKNNNNEIKCQCISSSFICT